MNTPRLLILQKILPLVPFDGWTQYALKEAGKSAGFDAAATAHAFPKGIKECMEFFFTQADEALPTLLPKATLAGMRVPERITALVLARLEYWLPHREAVRRAVSINALPWNAASALKALYRTVDIMWRLAGDTATDFNFYTKRATLAGVYSSTLLFWLNDTSDNQADTQEFLARRLSDVASFGRWKKQCSDAGSTRKAS